MTCPAEHLSKPVDGGPAIPVSQEGPAVEGPYRVIRFVAKDVPPLGYRTYLVPDDKTAPAGLAVDEKAGVMESPFFRATLDPRRGRIASLIDKRSGSRTGRRHSAAGLWPILLRAVRP